MSDEQPEGIEEILEAEEEKAEAAYTDAPPVDSHDAWDDLNAWLPDMLDELQKCDRYNTGNPPASTGRGIYLFSDGEVPLYVGRTGITARSRAAGKKPTSSFAKRWEQHTGEKSAPNSAPFAYKLASVLADLYEFDKPKQLKARFEFDRTADWFRKVKDLDEPVELYLAFQEAKRFLREDLDFRFVAFDDDVRGVRSHVAEVYADCILQANYNDFSTS